MSRFALVVLALITSSHCAMAGESVEPKLTPKQDVLKKLQSLPANTAVLLGAPGTVGDFNETAKAYRLHVSGPRGRDFSVKMVWAPERERVLFLGANHGSPHRLNDVWEFDLPSLTWALLYAPDHNRTYLGLGEDPSDVVFKDGVLITKRGGPAIIGHTWWGLTYDTDNRRVLFMNTWIADPKKLAASIGGNPEDVYKGPPLWAFYPATGKWEFVKTNRPWPRAPFGAALEYVPALSAAIWHSNHWSQYATWLYAPKTEQWIELSGETKHKEFRRQSPAQEQVAYLDPERKILVAQSGKRTHHFDLVRNEWSKVIDGDLGNDNVPTGHDAHTGFYYDPVSKNGLLVEHQTGKIWSYDPSSKRWEMLQPMGDPLPKGLHRLSYVDPSRNVLIIIQSDSVWAYRYRSATR